jgi:dipeptidyl aminopeptidase/acylaminoacyl peptidase
MKRVTISIIIFILVLLIDVIWWGISSHKFSNSQIFNPATEVKKELPYEKYSFEKLTERGGIASKIEVVGDKFYYLSEGRRISGEINFPMTPMSNKLPVIVMARGYVDKEVYKTGIGTHNSAMVYAKNGYITLAPDFSGYGGSDPEDPNALGARLVKPVEILDLIASLVSLPQADLSQVYLWGHSNGGQIMLSVAEILGRSENFKGSSFKVRGVTLWAPVSKPFPYNILYYTDDATDSGKWLRGQVAEFERDYDVFNYSVDRYLDWIQIPVQIHQGSSDEAVPKAWSDNLAKALREKEKQANYFVYPGADHNMKPGWDSVVARDVEWFNKLAED